MFQIVSPRRTPRHQIIWKRSPIKTLHATAAGAGLLIDYGSSNIIIEGWASPPAAVPELIVRRRARAAGERVILRFAKDFSPDDAAVPVVFVRAHLVDLCSDLGVGWQARLSWWIAGGLAGDSWTLFRTGSLEPTPDSFLDLPISDVGQFPR